MVLRKIIHIDEEKCNGCGLCIPSCAEGALQIIDGKARLVSDKLCDGLGACLKECPQGALQIIEREGDDFDEEAVAAHLGKKEHPHGHSHSAHSRLHIGGGCPGSRIRIFDEEQEEQEEAATTPVNGGDVEIRIKSQLKQWPVQLMLVPDKAPFFNHADLLLTADCVPFAYPNFHLDLLKGKTTVVGCPKLDDYEYYVEKLTEIISHNDLKSITVAYMEVPCCQGLVRAAELAIRASGKDIPLHTVCIGIDGKKL